MLGRISKLFLATLIFQTLLSAAGDLSPKYIRLFTDENGSGSWQMVGVAGFYNNVYGVEYSNTGSQSEYTSFYCEEPVAGSTIRTKTSSEADVTDDMMGYYWLFSIKVEEAIGSLSPLVVDVDSSQISCENVKQYSSGGGDGYTGMAIDKFVYRQSGGDEIAVFRHPTDTVATLVFSLDYDENKIYEVPLTQSRTDVYLDSADFPASDNEDYKKALSEKTQPVNEIVDLYLNDNPGFGDGNLTTYYSNYYRELRDYVTTKHQVPLDGDNDLANGSELRIYTYNSIDGTWLDYSNKNTENDFEELQAGKGYWMKFKNNTYISNGNTFDYIQTLELNDNYGKGTPSNLILTVNNVSYDINFTDSDIDSVLTELKDQTNYSRGSFTLQAVKIADNSILLKINYSSETDIKLKEVEVNNLDIFSNIPDSDKMFWTTKDIKSGLVLGDTSVTITSNSVYKNIATKGWNLLTLPTSTIRRSVTGIVFEDWDETITSVTISDPFGVNSVSIPVSTFNSSSQGKPSSYSKRINHYIKNAIATGELSTQAFNVRAYPIGANEGLVIISDDEFKIEFDSAHSSVTGKTLSGVDLTAGELVSQYGDYALLIQPNINSQITQNGGAKIEITAYSVGVDGNETEINKSIETVSLETNLTGTVAKINNQKFTRDSADYGTLLKAYSIDTDFSGTLEEDESILVISENTFYVKDTTYTKTYTYEPNRDGDIYIGVYQGNGANAELLNDTDDDDVPNTFAIIKKDSNFSSAVKSISEDYNNTENAPEMPITFYVFDENGSTVEGNQTEYIVVNSNMYNILLREVVTEDNISDDSLSLNKSFDIPETRGAILNVFQGNGLAKLGIGTDGVIDFSFPNNASELEAYQGAVEDLTGNSISTSDLISTNALITLSEAFESSSSYLPTMIVGSETSSQEGRIYWKSLSPVRKIDRWYNEYNLFSTHNQKAYWVYLDTIDNLQLDFGIINDGDTAPKITKNYIREFDNDKGTTQNYFNLTVSDVNVRGIPDELSGYVTVNLHGINEDLEAFDFPMQRISLGTTSLGGISPYQNLMLDYFEIPDLSSALQYVTITATDGRLSRDEFNISIDVQKPTQPQVSFVNGDKIESTKLYIISGDKSLGTNDDTVSFMVFTDRINDVTGVDNLIDEDNYIITITKGEGTTGLDSLCSTLKVENNSLDYFDLSIVALDNEDPEQANVSDITTVRYIPMSNTHVLVSNRTDDSADQLPTVYDETCVKSGTFKNSDNVDDDSGVSLLSLKDTTTFTYTPIEGASFSTTTPITMFVRDSFENRIAKIKFTNNYDGKNFFIHNNGNLYKGVFRDGCYNENNDEDFCELEKIENSGQTIGED
jgi:hypothetical protein